MTNNACEAIAATVVDVQQLLVQFAVGGYGRAAIEAKIIDVHAFALNCACTWFNYAQCDHPVDSSGAWGLKNELVLMASESMRLGIGELRYQPDPFVRDNPVSIDGRMWESTSYHRHVFEWVAEVFGELLCLAGFQKLGDCWEFKNGKQVLEAIGIVFKTHSSETVSRAVIGEIKQPAIMNLMAQLEVEYSQATRRTASEAALLNTVAIAKHAGGALEVETGSKAQALETATFSEMEKYFETVDGFKKSNSFFRREVRKTELKPAPGAPTRYYLTDLERLFTKEPWELVWKKASAMKVS